MELPKKYERIVVWPLTTEIMLEWKDENGKINIEWIATKKLTAMCEYEQKE